LCRPQPEQETPKIVVESAKFMTRRAAPKGPEASVNDTPLETDFRYKIFHPEYPQFQGPVSLHLPADKDNLPGAIYGQVSTLKFTLSHYLD